MNFITRVSKGLQAVIGGAIAVAGTIVSIAPQILPFLPPKLAGRAGLVAGVAGAIVSTLSHPPQTAISGTSVSPAIAAKLGLPQG